MVDTTTQEQWAECIKNEQKGANKLLSFCLQYKKRTQKMFAKYKADKYRYIKQYEKVKQNTRKKFEKSIDKKIEKS